MFFNASHESSDASTNFHHTQQKAVLHNREKLVDILAELLGAICCKGEIEESGRDKVLLGYGVQQVLDGKLVLCLSWCIVTYHHQVRWHWARIPCS